MPTVNKPKTRAATADRHEPRSRVCTSCHKLPRFCDCAPGAEPTCPICHNVMSSGQHFPDIQTCLTAEQVAAGRTGAVAVNEARFSQPLRRDVSKPLTWCGLGAVIVSRPTKQERLVHAEAEAARHLGNYNAEMERGAVKTAAKSLEKAQRWLDKANDLSGRGST